jgi:hypothetical protein
MKGVSMNKIMVALLASVFLMATQSLMQLIQLVKPRLRKETGWRCKDQFHEKVRFRMPLLPVPLQPAKPRPARRNCMARPRTAS